jgi:hypothetical protein
MSTESVYKCDACGKTAEFKDTSRWSSISLSSVNYEQRRRRNENTNKHACSRVCEAKILADEIDRPLDAAAIEAEASALYPDLAKQVESLKAEVARRDATAPQSTPLTHEELRALLSARRSTWSAPSRVLVRWAARRVGLPEAAVDEPLQFAASKALDALVRRFGP